jgi:hypothetical protein
VGSFWIERLQDRPGEAVEKTNQIAKLQKSSRSDPIGGFAFLQGKARKALDMQPKRL